MALVNRLSAVLLCLGLIAGNGAVCAGWLPSPEARMACCAEGDDCPMHKGGSDATDSGRTLTQAQADACCASSEDQQSSSSTPSGMPAISFSVLGAGVVLQARLPALVLSDDWRTADPIPIAPVARHVLLSVFLV